MIPAKTNITQVSNLPGERIAMEISNPDRARLMKLLTNLYAYPKSAVLREYSTNAFDSHIETGITAPIRITTPSALDPSLKIQDEGMGLSSDDIRNVYSKYGASTKLESNDLQGMLGLGSKSALTYTSQFTVTSVKNGIRCVVSVSQEEDGTYVMTILDESPTTEHNGVEISIPAKYGDDFEEEVEELFKWWDPTTVLINNKPPAVTAKGIRINDHIEITENLEQDMLVMGNVAYPLTNFNNREMSYGWHTVLRVDIGEVKFAPSREALEYSPLTMKRIKQAEEEFQRDWPSAVQRTFEEQTTKDDALKLATKWERVFRNNVKVRFSWQGKTVPFEFKAREVFYDIITMQEKRVNIRKIFVSDENQQKEGQFSKYESLTLGQLEDVLIVQGFEVERFALAHKRKLQKYVDKLNEGKSDADRLKVRRYVLSGPLLSHAEEWLDPARIAHWDDIKSIKLEGPKVMAGSIVRLKGSYDVIEDGTIVREVPADLIEDQVANHPEKKLLYALGRKGMRVDGQAVLDEYFPKGYLLVMMTSNREGKFKRLFPQSETITEAIHNLVEGLFAKIPQNDLIALNFRDRRFFLEAHPRRIEDDELAKAVRLARKKEIAPEIAELQSIARRLNAWRITDKLIVEYKDPLEPYVLVNSSERPNDHHYIYINAAYTHLRKAKVAK